jgi:hypothetical protein
VPWIADCAPVLLNAMGVGLLNGRAAVHYPMRKKIVFQTPLAATALTAAIAGGSRLVFPPEASHEGRAHEHEGERDAPLDGAAGEDYVAYVSTTGGMLIVEHIVPGGTFRIIG